ncbi:integral membrane protein [Lichtheimia corymbifera JMRC:FSU:9682]|uniref:Integral membrane protein n=1 Tax=Lichtheimia corymbifera JMRC:FSU:9682 TaxID=1263082 RepID=A0A068SEG7_9FUNG|nr:integral membrane protein [Lichtheimia corymbifera JMRC:FSU:9682]
MDDHSHEHEHGATGHSHNLDPSVFETSAATDEPIGYIMALHITFMVISFGFLFPFGMVLGLARNRWHVPVQILATALFVVGYFLAHAHAGRNYEPHIAHRWFASILIWLLVGQLAIGVYLKLHLERGIHGRIRPFVVPFHKVLGALVPVIGYVQILLGVIASLGFCYGDHTGQCLAHFIMGSSFVGYGILMLLSLRVGGPWLLRRGKSQEWYDSWVIMLWGIVNTFTEHRWGQPWNHGDYQHTSMGIIWWIAGAVGIVLSRNGNRSVIPSVLIMLTAVSFFGHAQHVPNSEKLHSYFGYMLMAGGFSRIIEICFVWKEGNFSISPFQYIPPLTLMLSGLLFMGSNEEQLLLLSALNIDPGSYSNILLSFGFAVFLFSLGLILLWEKLTQYLPSAASRTQPAPVGDYSQLNNVETIHDASSDFLEDDEDEDAMQLKTRVGPNHI